MKKIAGDIVHRIWDGLSKIEIVDKPLDKKTLFQCFLAGKSVARYWKKAVKNGRSDLGRELIVNHDGDEKSYLTSDLFEKPRTLKTTGIGQYYSSKQLTASTDKYLLRYSFDFEEDECQHHIRVNDPHLTNFLNADKYLELMRMKDEVIDELAYKFLADDKKVILTMKDVLNEHFEKTGQKIDYLSDRFNQFIKDQSKGQKELLENQHELLENQKGNQNELMVAIKQIQIKIDDPLNYNHNVALQKELQATKQLLEEEKKARRVSRKIRRDHHDIELDTFDVVQPQPQDDIDMINHEENQFGMCVFSFFLTRDICRYYFKLVK